MAELGGFLEGEAVEDCQARAGTDWMITAPSERQALDSLDPVLRLYHERLARQDAAALGTATFDALLDELPAAPRPAD